MSDLKEIPKKLQDDLANAKFYKQSSGNSSKEADAAGAESGKSRVRKAFDDSKEKAMYDEIFGSVMRSRDTSSILSTAPAAASPRNSFSIINGGSVATNPTDFTTSLLKRLKLVESEAKDARAKLAEQTALNEALKNEIKDLKTIATDPSDLICEIQLLRGENEQLHDQISEMEDFLGDYGLAWVGSKADKHDIEGFYAANGPSNAGTATSASASEAASNIPGSDKEVDKPAAARHPMAYADFLKAVDDLNGIIHAEPAKVVVTGGDDKQQRKARLAQASELVDHVRIIFYRNGLLVKQGPFRACGTEGYISFVKDIMDGYFPGEFKDEYPDGVVFNVKDEHDADYIEGSSPNRLTKAQFLNRLPKTVIHKGEIVDVRGSIESRLGEGHTGSKNNNGSIISSSGGVAGGGGGGGKNSPGSLQARVVISTPASIACAAARAAVDGEATAGDKQDVLGHSMGRIVQIQVKWVDGSVLIASMYEMNTVGDLRDQIVQHVQPTTEEDKRDVEVTSGSVTVDGTTAQKQDLHEKLPFEFELRSAYPPRLLAPQVSLMEAGLTPNGTVHARKI